MGPAMAYEHEGEASAATADVPLVPRSIDLSKEPQVEQAFAFDPTTTMEQNEAKKPVPHGEYRPLINQDPPIEIETSQPDVGGRDDDNS
jgi:hypothetical protein